MGQRAEGEPTAPYLLAVGTDGTHWGYAGVEVNWTADLTRDRAFSELDPPDRLAAAVEQQRTWLDTVLDSGVTLDLRYRTQGRGGPVECAVLVRAAGLDAESLDMRVAALIRRLAQAPSHVGVTPLTGVQLQSWIAPFEPHPAGRAIIRKRADVGVPNRPDAQVERYWAVTPLRTTPKSWAPALNALRASSDPTMLSICLETLDADPDLETELDRMATFYGRLARDGEASRSSLYKSSSKLAPDAFAVDANTVFSDLAKRYRARSHRMRVAVLSSGALEVGVLSTLAGVLSPPETPHDDVNLSGPLASSSTEHVFVGPANHKIFDQTVRTLGTAPFLPSTAPAFFARVSTVQHLVDAREAATACRLPIAETGVLSGFPVRSPEFAVAAAAPRATAGARLSLGTQIADGNRFSLDLDDLTMHAFVVGTTGSGKTSTVLGMLDELWRRHRIPWLVIEPVNSSGDDYRWFLERDGFDEMVVFTAGDDSVAPLRLNIFEVPSGVTVGEHLTSVLSVFDSAFGLWDPLPAIYRRALEQTYFEAGFSLIDRGGPRSWPTVREFAAEMRRVTDQLEYSGEVRSNIIAASIVRVEQLCSGPLRSVFDCQTSTPLATLLDRPCVIELAKVGASNESEAALVIASLLTAVAEHRRAGPSSRTLRHVVVVEEAHKLLKNSEGDGGGGADRKGDAGAAASRMFANLLAEIRKYGQALIVADQDPAKLVPDAYKNTNLKVMHRLPSKDDRELVGGTMRFDDDHVHEASALSRFTAFVHAEGFDRPALVSFENIRASDQRSLPEDEVLRRRFGALVATNAAAAASIPPYPECAGCPHVCSSRSWAQAAASRRAVHTQFSSAVSLEGGTAVRRAAIFSLLDEVAGPDAALRYCLTVHLARARFDSGTVEFVQIVQSTDERKSDD